MKKSLVLLEFLKMITLLLIINLSILEPELLISSFLELKEFLV